MINDSEVAVAQNDRFREAYVAFTLVHLESRLGYGAVGIQDYGLDAG
jgi:hypothetical protein